MFSKERTKVFGICSESSIKTSILEMASFHSLSRTKVADSESQRSISFISLCGIKICKTFLFYTGVRGYIYGEGSTYTGVKT